MKNHRTKFRSKSLDVSVETTLRNSAVLQTKEDVKPNLTEISKPSTLQTNIKKRKLIREIPETTPTASDQPATIVKEEETSKCSLSQIEEKCTDSFTHEIETNNVIPENNCPDVIVISSDSECNERDTKSFPTADETSKDSSSISESSFSPSPPRKQRKSTNQKKRKKPCLIIITSPQRGAEEGEDTSSCSRSTSLSRSISHRRESKRSRRYSGTLRDSMKNSSNEIYFFDYEKVETLLSSTDLEKLKEFPSEWHFTTSMLIRADSLPVMPAFIHLVKTVGTVLYSVKFINDINDEFLISTSNFFGVLRTFTQILFSCATNIRELCLSGSTSEVLNQFLCRIFKCPEKEIRNLRVLKITDMSGCHIFDELNFEILLKHSQDTWKQLVLRDLFFEPINEGFADKNFLYLLDRDSTTELLDIHGGMYASEIASLPTNLKLVFPQKPHLKHLGFRMLYCEGNRDCFIKQIKQSRPSDIYSNSIPEQNIKVSVPKRKLTLKFEGWPNNLHRLVLGNQVDLIIYNEGFFSKLLKQLKIFHCASSWHLKLFSSDPNNKAPRFKSSVSSLQLPDCFRDDELIPKIAMMFPHVTKLIINLPSVSVLRSIFFYFGAWNLEELTLRTQFDFDSVLDSVLFPQHHRSPNQETLNTITRLKEYKYFNEFVDYYNLDLPEQSKKNSLNKGIDNLKHLRSLFLQHIPRKLRIPLPEETKRWDELGCKFCPSSSSGLDESVCYISRQTQIGLHNIPSVVLEAIQVCSTLTQEQVDSDSNETL